MQTYKIDFLTEDERSIESKNHPANSLSDAIAQSGSMYFKPEAAYVEITTPSGETVLFVNPDYKGDASKTLESKESLIEKHKAQEQKEEKQQHEEEMRRKKEKEQRKKEEKEQRKKEEEEQRNKEEEQRNKEEEQRKKEEEQRKKEEEQRKKEMRRKEEERRIQSVISALKKEIDSGNDYLGITSGLRNDAEGMSSAILKRNLDDWSSHESELIRTVNSFPERQRYFSLISETKKLSGEAEGGNDKHILAELQKLNGLMETLVQGQGKQIGMSKDNQNAAKIGIAAHLLTGGISSAVEKGIDDAFEPDEE